MSGNKIILKQKALSLYDPNLFAAAHPGIWLLWSIYFLLLLFSFQQLIFTCKRSKLQKNLLKKGFLFFLTVFLFFRTFLSFVVTPLRNTVIFLILHEQFPRYVLFVAWQMLGLWIGSAVSLTEFKSPWKNCYVIGSLVLYVILFFVLLIIAPFLTYEKGNGYHYTNLEKIDHIPNCIAYFCVLLSIGYFGGRLIYLLRKSTRHLGSVNWRVVLLMLMVIITFLCFLGRFMWTLFDSIGVNAAQDAINKLVNNCDPDDDACSWNTFYWIHFTYYFITEGIPPITLMLTFILLSMIPHSTSYTSASYSSVSSGRSDPLQTSTQKKRKAKNRHKNKGRDRYRADIQSFSYPRPDEEYATGDGSDLLDSTTVPDYGTTPQLDSDPSLQQDIPYPVV